MAKNDFLNGVIKLEKEIFDDIDKRKNGVPTFPYYDIPEEIDCKKGLCLSSDLGTIMNTGSIYDIYMGDIKVLTTKNTANPLSQIIKSEIEETGGYITETTRNFIHNTYNIFDIVLTAELHKEISDVYYLIMNHLSKASASIFVTSLYPDVTDPKNAPSEEFQIRYIEIAHNIFSSLVDEEFIHNLYKLITDSRLYRKTNNMHLFYNYVTLFRTRLMTNISYNTYNTLRNIAYGLDTPSTPATIISEKLDRLAFDYLYVLDQITNIITVAFGVKIEYCYNDIGDFINAIEENSNDFDD